MTSDERFAVEGEIAWSLLAKSHTFTEAGCAAEQPGVPAVLTDVETWDEQQDTIEVLRHTNGKLRKLLGEAVDRSERYRRALEEILGLGSGYRDLFDAELIINARCIARKALEASDE